MLNTLWVIMMAMKIVIMMVMVMRRTMKTFGGKRRIISNANEEDKFVRDDDDDDDCGAGVRSVFDLLVLRSPSSEMKRMNDRYQGVNFHAEGVSCF